MYQAPYEKMVCDSDYGDGGVYFYDDYFEWINRSTGSGFRIKYENIRDIDVVFSNKKKVIILLNSGEKRNLYLYKHDVLVRLLNEAIERVKNKPVNEAISNEEDDITKLERLAKLHDSGALTDEEFAKAKQKILGQKT